MSNYNNAADLNINSLFTMLFGGLNKKGSKCLLKEFIETLIDNEKNQEDEQFENCDLIAN